MLIIYVPCTLCILIHNVNNIYLIRNLSPRILQGVAVPAPVPELQLSERGGEKLNWCSYVPESLQSYGSLSEFKQGKLIHIPRRRGEEV